MNGLGGMLALIGGFLYLVISFALGMQMGSLLVALSVLALATFAAITALATVLPAARIWYYPLIFSLPTLLVGVIAIGDNFSFLGIGTTALCAGLVSEYIVRWRRALTSRSAQVLSRHGSPQSGSRHSP